MAGKMMKTYVLDEITLEARVGVEGTHVSVEMTGYILHGSGSIEYCDEFRLERPPLPWAAENVKLLLEAFVKDIKPEVTSVDVSNVDEDEFEALNAALKALSYV